MKKDDASYIETPVEISGSDDQINKAKELIQEIIGPSSSVINNMGGTYIVQVHDFRFLHVFNKLIMNSRFL